MSKVVLFAASLLLVAGIATAGIINPCGAPVVYTGVQPECYFSCPQGDTDTFLASGFWFSFTILDLLGQPIQFIPATDFWLVDCDAAKDLVLCGGAACTNADSATNSLGKTTMSQVTLRVGGCATGLSPVCQGFVLQNPVSVPPCTNYCFTVKVRSADLNAVPDLKLDLIDLSIFSTGYPSPPKVLNVCLDFDCNGNVNLQDLSKFSFHFGPPGHKCQ
jgi:hypothetical protein